MASFKVMENKGAKYVEEFNKWREELKPFWDQIDKNQEMYEFYRREESETRSDISLNTTFSIIESMVAKANESNLNITVNAKGETGLNELEKWISSVLKDAIEDTDVAQYKGSFRKQREKFFRNLLVQGNAIATIEWFKKKVNGKVLAENPYFNVRELKSVVFDPTKTLCTSDVYYIESYLKFQDLKDNELNKKSGKGKYKNLAEVKKQAKDKEIDIEDEYDYSDEKKIVRKASPIRILERYEGTEYKIIALNGIIIYEENDPFGLMGHNIVTAMNYVVRNRPYAYGEIDPIYKPVRAQDTIVNQGIDLVNKKLRSSIAVKPGTGTEDLDAIIDVVENGGVITLDPATIGAIPTQDVPAQAFQTVEVMQQAIERASRFSPYATGVASASTDKTKGTMGGIQSLQMAAEPNFTIKLDTLEDAMRIMARMYLKMIANKMLSTDFRYGMLQGKSSEWVKANKAVLQGKATIPDLVKIGFMTEEQAQKYLFTQDETTGEIIPIPEADKALVFDIDWLVDIRLDNQSAVDKEKMVDRTINLVDFGQKIGVQFSPERTWKYVAEREGEDDPENLLMTDEEKSLAQQQQMMAQQAQEQKDMQMKQMELEAKAQSESNKAINDLNKEAMRGQSAQAVAGMRTNVQSRGL